VGWFIVQKGGALRKKDDWQELYYDPALFGSFTRIINRDRPISPMVELSQKGRIYPGNDPKNVAD